jgi:hypothetical protein
MFEDWRQYYNQKLPHRSLGLQTPAAFAKNQREHGSGRAEETKTAAKPLIKSGMTREGQSVDEEKAWDLRPAVLGIVLLACCVILDILFW